jgi:hypothetical protein
MKHFSTFKEIDAALRIHSLQRDIAREGLVLKWHTLQHDVKPASMALQFGLSLKKSIVYFLATALLRKIQAVRKG